MATTAPDLPPALARALSEGVQVARGLFGAAACSVAVVDLDGGSLRFVASHGSGERAIVGVAVPVHQGIAGWVARSGSTVVVADVTTDQRFARDVAESTGYVPTTILAAPVMGDDEPVGVLSVLDPTRRERELDLLSGVGALLSGTLLQHSPRALRAMASGPSSGAGTSGREPDDAAAQAFSDQVDAVRALDPGRRRLAAALLRALVADAEGPA